MRALAPLLLGVVPFAIAFALSARSAGISLLDTQLMSLALFSGGAQGSAVGLLAAGAGPGTLLATTLLINARHVLYGLTLALPRPIPAARLVAAAFMLTDEAFGVALALGRRSLAFLLGAETLLFLVWNVTTFAAALAAGAIPNPLNVGLDLVIPLMFVALTVPQLKLRRDVLVAGGAAALALVLLLFLPAGAAILVAALATSLAAAAWPPKGSL